KGRDAGANEAVVKKLAEVGALVARGRLKHQYPHSWRSKAPLIFRNTPQWFIAMDKAIGSSSTGRDGTALGTVMWPKNDPAPQDTLRHRALTAIKTVQWVPATGENRITGMIENRPDWVVSRQRAWGVPIAVFVKKGSNEILKDERVNKAIADAFAEEGADAWFKDADGARFLTPFGFDPAGYEKVNDILDVWFDSGSTHAFTLEVREDLKARRKADGGPDTVMYLEGSDQHRGWFHSSLLESCGTRGRAPFDIVLTHGFVLDERGEKMSKSKGNVTAPQDVIKDSGADILRLWVAASDYSDDLRIGREILKTFVETYRKLRNTIRWMLGSLHHFREEDRVQPEAMPELERFILHRLAELDQDIRGAYAGFDYKRVVALLNSFMTSDLSAFYFDIRKDALYCDPISGTRRKSALTVIDVTFRCVATWIAPILAFTAEEAWLSRHPSEDGSVHLETFPAVPAAWRDEALAHKWATIRMIRRVVTGALEVERAHKRIGSSLEAAPIVYISAPRLMPALDGVDFAEICITSSIEVRLDPSPPAKAFRVDESGDIREVAV
ncbi:MAG TPA: class I tRNA ligase family protein, partial [Beijerinckiaceae bacterium]|nr:class I tRNA ligase family protein [Beijerinckiaceae bacterium]